jgi:hypothetical protein
VTFANVASDRSAGEVGVAVASWVLAVGAFCPYVRGGVGAVSSQAYLNPYLGYDCVRLMTEGVAVGEAVDRLLAGDPGRDWRQLIAVDAAGQPRAHTGPRVDPWCGDLVGDGFAVAGNILYGPQTLDAMAETFVAWRRATARAGTGGAASRRRCSSGGALSFRTSACGSTTTPIPSPSSAGCTASRTRGRCRSARWSRPPGSRAARRSSRNDSMPSGRRWASRSDRKTRH